MKNRIISAAIMLAICIPLIIIGGIPFRIFAGIIGLLAYKEILDLKGFNNYPKGVIVLGCAALLLLIYSNKDPLFSTIGLDYKYIAVTFLLLFLPTIFYYNTKKYTTADAFKLTAFVMFIGLFLNMLSNILIYDKAYFFLIVLVTILTDTFAFFAGMALGKHKVTKISPKKSLEGYIGGVVMGTILSSIYYMTFIGNVALSSVIPVLIMLTLACELGDLFFSAIKREYEIKDFSNLIPGHGGILDRIDSLTFVTIAFILLRGLI